MRHCSVPIPLTTSSHIALALVLPFPLKTGPLSLLLNAPPLSFLLLLTLHSRLVLTSSCEGFPLNRLEPLRRRITHLGRPPSSYPEGIPECKELVTFNQGTGSRRRGDRRLGVRWRVEYEG